MTDDGVQKKPMNSTLRLRLVRVNLDNYGSRSLSITLGLMIVRTIELDFRYKLHRQCFSFYNPRWGRINRCYVLIINLSIFCTRIIQGIAIMINQ